mgnify:CR=1 FL=1
MVAGATDVVEHRQQGLKNAGHREVARDVPVAVDAAAVVDVLRLQAFEVVDESRLLAANLVELEGEPVCVDGVGRPSRSGTSVRLR